MRSIVNGSRFLTALSALAVALITGSCGSTEPDAPRTFTVGGTVSGLVGVQCSLRNNGTDHLVLTANGPFTFNTALPDGSDYSVSLFAHPTGPTQNCVVDNNNGTISGANVTSIQVTCALRTPGCGVATDLGAVTGDQDVSGLSTTGMGEGWFRVRVSELSNSSVPVTASVILELPSGIDYDLYVTCVSCGGALAGTSQRGTGLTETVGVRWADRAGPDDSADILIRVAYVSGSSAEPFTLRVRGNQPVGATTCAL